MPSRFPSTAERCMVSPEIGDSEQFINGRLILILIALDEAARQLLNPQLPSGKARLQLLDDFQKLGLGIDAAVGDQLLLVLAGQGLEVPPGLGVVDHAHQGSEDLIEARFQLPVDPGNGAEFPVIPEAEHLKLIP